MTAVPAVTLAGAHLRLGRIDALAGIDLRLDAGEQVAVIGPSGAGKSSLMAVLNLGRQLDAGTLALHGVAVAGLGRASRRSLRARIATVHQHHDLVGRLDVLRNVLAGRLGRWGAWASLRAMIAPRQAEVAEAIADLGRVGLADRWRDRADRLSGGQQQRVAVARALFQGAELLLADEPVASLDPVQGAALLRLLGDIARQDGRTLLVSLHQPTLAVQCFPRIVGMRAGRIVFDLPAERVAAEQLAALYAGSPAPTDA